MNSKIKYIVPVAFATLLAAGCNKSPAPTADNNQSQEKQQVVATPTPQPTPSAPVSVKFTDQTYYKDSYLISGPTLGDDAKQALAGFVMTKKAMPDGTTQINLKATKVGYYDQQYTLHTGEQLYFIEKFMQDDDNEANEDKNLKDDLAVVVDSNGNVLSQPVAWPGDASSTPPSQGTMPPRAPEQK